MGSYKAVFGKDIDGWVKDSSNTERKLFDSTGALYPGGVKMTPASTAAFTVVDTTTVQALTNKTINNITITDPGSAATLTITSGGTLEAIGAFQHKFTSTANSAVTLPAATDAMLMWTTEASAKITAPTSQINVLGVAVWPSTAAHTIVATTAAQTLENKTLGAGTISNVETGSTAANLVNYGVSLLAYSSDAGKAYTLAAPAAGVGKTVILNTTVAPDTTGVFSSVYTGSTAIFIMDNSTAYAPKLYAGFGPPYSIVELVGVTTALWGVRNAYGNAKFSTSATFST